MYSFQASRERKKEKKNEKNTCDPVTTKKWKKPCNYEGKKKNCNYLPLINKATQADLLQRKAVHMHSFQASLYQVGKEKKKKKTVITCP